MGKQSRLGNVVTGRMSRAYRYAFYGPEGVGKTSLAADSDAPIFFDLEDGSSLVDVPRYRFRDGPDGHVPRHLVEVSKAVADLLENEHSYRTLVIDTVDRLETLIWEFCLARDSGKQSQLNKNGKKLESIESYGYGKGYNVALDIWRRICRNLDELRSQRRVSIVLLGHTMIRTFKNPEGDDYDRYQLAVNERAGGLIREWCDVVGFCRYEERGGKLSDDDNRPKGFSTGRRLIQLKRTAAFNAKSRLTLPDQLELEHEHPWAPLARAVAELQNQPSKEEMKA